MLSYHLHPIAWAVAGDIAAGTQGCSTDDADEPIHSQPAKLSTAAKLQRGKQAQQQPLPQQLLVPLCWLPAALMLRVWQLVVQQAPAFSAQTHPCCLVLLLLLVV